MFIFKNLFLLFLLVFTLHAALYAQSNASQQISDSAVLNAKKFHQNSKYNSLEIFSGNVYNGYLKSTKGSPYYKYDDFVPANITFRGIEYFDMPVKYDVYIKTLILLHHNNFMNLIIENEGIEKFKIGNEEFVHIKQGEIRGILPTIYRYIDKGKYTVLVNDKVELVEKVNITIERDFIKKNEYFLLKDNQAYFIRSQKEFLKLMEITKKEFKSINKNFLFKSKINKEEYIKIVTSHKNSQ